MRSRAWIYILSVAALLGPAVGIAYLGAVTLRNERGAVAAQIERQRQAADAVVGGIKTAVAQALDQADRAADGNAGVTAALGRYWFWIDADGSLRVPRAAPTTVTLGATLDRGVECATVEECNRADKGRRERQRALQAARRAESRQEWPEARRQYLLASSGETEPLALLGLARVYAQLGDPARAAQASAELEQRFADRTIEGVPMRLVLAILRAEASGADALLALGGEILDGKYKLDPIVRLGVLARVRRGLERGLTDPQRARRAGFDERVAAIRGEARAAAGLAEELPELERTAAASWRGRPASHEAARTLIYRKRRDGGIVGISVDALMLEAVAAGDRAHAVAQRAQPLVLGAGERPPPGSREIVRVALGAELQHLSLVLANPIADPDPLDEVIRERSRRHVVYTSALAIALGLGLLATIRGAARARELARLKSDFVSTVSHELKTPLTSIRMFAEMLEQGVAQGDAQKQARYHSVIVQESQRLGLLIANLLDYAQIERGTRRYTTVREDIGQLARHAVTTFETLRDPEPTRRNKISITVSPEAANVDVDVDRDVVVQAVLNLLANAVKYGGGTVDVEVGADAMWASIAVRDYGPGIPPVEQARIFREFYRAPEAYRAGVEGTGLGLALVKRHVEALGGTVSVASTVGEGATFTIKLPRRARDEEVVA